jgi:hypothetical protein
MSPAMRDALGTAQALAGVRDDVRRRLGAEAEVLSERVRRDGDHDVYERLARWTGSPPALRITVALDAGGRVAGFWVRPQRGAAESSYLDYRTRAELRLPFDGAWYVLWGGRTLADNRHAGDAAQRFAMDVLVRRDGRSHAGDPGVPASYHCWDRPILAPADGVVVRAVDGLPDQRIGERDPANPAGNHVVIDFGHGEYGFLAHLRRGSVAVAAGDRVAAGAPIGRCGNSGNSSEPHLHFHLQTTPDLGRGDGLPAQFAAYRADGATVENGEPRRGQTIAPVE